MAWKNPQTRQEIEAALDARKLYVVAGQDKYWLARRNGKTQTWKTRPAEFRIPIKYGYRDCAAIEQHTSNALMRVADSREAAEGPEE